jgi:hypothetical protein
MRTIEIGCTSYEFIPGFQVRFTRSLVLCVCFVDRCLSFCTFFFWPKKYCGLFVLGRLCFSTHRGMYKMSIKDEINFPIVRYPFVCINIPVVPPYGYSRFQYRRACKYQRGNQNPYIEEEQTTQWPKEFPCVLKNTVDLTQKDHSIFCENYGVFLTRTRY